MNHTQPHLDPKEKLAHIQESKSTFIIRFSFQTIFKVYIGGLSGRCDTHSTPKTVLIAVITELAVTIPAKNV